MNPHQPTTNEPQSTAVALRAVSPDDLPILFQQQLDPTANWMAAFTAEDPSDWEAYWARWMRILADPTVFMRTIVCDGAVAGSIATFEQFGEPSISYWIGREFWGQGVATRALAAFLQQVMMRPLYARAAKDNIASLRVLEKCGFVICGEDRGFSNARGVEVEEYVLRLA